MNVTQGKNFAWLYAHLTATLIPSEQIELKNTVSLAMQINRTRIDQPQTNNLVITRIDASNGNSQTSTTYTPVDGVITLPANENYIYTLSVNIPGAEGPIEVDRSITTDNSIIDGTQLYLVTGSDVKIGWQTLVGADPVYSYWRLKVE